MRLLDVPMRHVDAPRIALLFDRFFAQQSAWLGAGGTLEYGHLEVLASTWNEHCTALDEAQRQALRALAAVEVQEALTGCL